MGKMVFWANKKLYDPKNHNKLLGYRVEVIECDNPADLGQVRDITKDALKKAVASGLVEVKNMTLASNGIFIGKATKHKATSTSVQKVTEKTPVITNAKTAIQNNDRKQTESQKEKQKENAANSTTSAKSEKAVVNTESSVTSTSGIKVLEIYTNGRRISAAMIDGKTNCVLEGLKEGVSFDIGIDVMSNIKNRVYANVSIENSRITGQFRKKSFKSIKNKLINIIKKNCGIPKLIVSKHSSTGEYKIAIEEIVDNEVIIKIAMSLILDEAYSENLMPLCVDDNTALIVKCATGINDVRKAMKQVFVLEGTSAKGTSTKGATSKTSKSSSGNKKA